MPRRPSGIPEDDVRSTMVPYLLKHRSHLRRVLREKEEENRKVAESVLMGRERIAELQQLIQAHQQAWQVKTDQPKPDQTKPTSQHSLERSSVGPGMIFKPSTSPRSPQQPSPAETLDLGFFFWSLRCFSLCSGWDVGWCWGK